MMNPDESYLKQFWKSKPSLREGYYKNYYLETPEGDRMEIDFNFPRQMIRIAVFPAGENGKEYASVIKSGTILQERDITRRRPVDLTSRIQPLGKYFGLLYDDTILKTIGKNYGIPSESLRKGAVNSHEFGNFYRKFQSKNKTGFIGRIRKYLEKKRERESRNRPLYKKILRRLPDEMLDLGLGTTVVLFNHFDLISLGEMAVLLGFLGLLTGAFDWVWRQRDPFLPKVVFMLSLSLLSMHEQIQYRVWGMFL